MLIKNLSSAAHLCNQKSKSSSNDRYGKNARFCDPGGLARCESVNKSPLKAKNDLVALRALRSALMDSSPWQFTYVADVGTPEGLSDTFA